MSRFKRCYYCETEFTKVRLLPGEIFGDDFVDRTKDHVIPLSRGGINHPKNLVPACVPCNRAKSNLFLEEFLELLKLGKPTHLGKKKIAKIIPNIEKLILTIEPYRHELFRKGFEQANITIKQIVGDRLKFRPSSARQEQSQEQFLITLKKKYPYVNELLINANSDLPRWIYDNLIKME